MLSDKRYGLSVNIMATRVMPSLLPQTVNPSLNLEQFTILIEVRTTSFVLSVAVSLAAAFILHGLDLHATHLFALLHWININFLCIVARRCCKRCWTISTDSRGTNSSWIISRYHRHHIGRCATSSPRTTCTFHRSTFLIYESTSGRRRVRRTWHGRIPLALVWWVAGGSADRPRRRTAISCVSEMRSLIADCRKTRWWLPRYELHRLVRHRPEEHPVVDCRFVGTRALVRRRGGTRPWICRRPRWV